MRGWPALSLVAATAFAMSLTMFFVAKLLPGMVAETTAATSRSFIVGSGGILAATCVIALYSALLRQVYLDRDPRPLVTMHPRHRG